MNKYRNHKIKLEIAACETPALIIEYAETTEAIDSLQEFRVLLLEEIGRRKRAGEAMAIDG